MSYSPDPNRTTFKIAAFVMPFFIFKENTAPLDSSNAARRVLDGVKYVSETVSAYSAPSSRAVSDWIADQVAPDYWTPNSQITVST
jgi:hypothetical protein